MRAHVFLFLAVSAAAMLSACGGDDAGEASGVDHTFDDGVRVLVEGGAVEVSEGDRTLWAMPAGSPPVARTFTDGVSGSLAIYTFRRFDVEETVFDRFRGAELADDGAVVATWGSSGDATATLRIAPGERERTTSLRLSVEGMEPTSIALPIRCDEDGTFHGFGEQYNATDQRGEAFTLFVSEQGIGRAGGLRDLAGDEHTTYFPMPYYVDARGHGMLLSTERRVETDLCATDPEVAWLEVVDAAPIESTIFHGPTPLDVVGQLSAEVGIPAEPPSWAFDGAWISSQGGRDAVEADVAALEAAEIPVSAIWSQDWTGVRMNIGGGFGVQYRWEPDLEHYPDLGGMIDDLHSRGIRFLAYANPFVDPELPNHFDEMADQGLLIGGPDGESYVFGAPNGESSHPDFTNPETQEYVKGELVAMVNDYGIDGWMADFGEWNPLDAEMDGTDDPIAYHNHFPVDWHAANRAAMDEARPDGDWVLFARSGYTGVQRYSMIHWVGDQEANWSEHDGLPTVVPAMISLGLAGVPYVTHDIAGFSGGPSTKELYMRWTELGAFTPIMRTHEGNRRDVNHNWDTDPETTEHFRRFARIHAALAPELEALAAEAQETGAPMVRHLMLVFPDDRDGWGVSDQYMLGDSLLVAPVLTEGATSREVYLPPGTWFHVFTGEMHEGGATVTVDAPLGQPPVFSLGEDRADLRAIE